jgi:hypothetical protein
MIGGPIRLSRWRRRAMLALLAASFVAICLYPHIVRLARPSIFSDDVLRIEEVQTMRLGQLLSRPFNEHFAPLFDLVTWVTWQVAGRRLSRAPSAFTASSLIPFGFCLLALGMLVRRETGSPTAALAAVAILSLSPVHVEVAWWYSASSFAWALLGTLLAWCCVLRSLRVGGPATTSRAIGWGIAAASFAVAAPAFSAIGLLAGPVASLRAVLDASRPRHRRTIAVGLIPLVGTVVYLMVASRVDYHRILAHSIDRNRDISTGLLCTLCAPIDVLVPGVLGVDNADRWLRGGPAAILGGLFLLAILAWGLRGRGRPMSLGALALMLGGYAMTLPVRGAGGTHWLLEVQRYHLFPQLGFVLVLVEASRPWLARFDRRPLSALSIATVLAALLMTAHRPTLERRAWTYRFPDQAATMNALERLESLCRLHRIARGQAMAGLEPIETRWSPRAANALMMLGDPVSASGLPDDRVRPTLLSSLSPSEREALCGGMDASPYLERSAGPARADVLAVGRLVDSSGISREGPGDRFLARGPAYLEFEMSDGARPVPLADGRGLSVPVAATGGRIEVWWAAEGSEWSRTRSVRWPPDCGGSDTPWLLRLERLPHWSPSQAARIRIIVRSTDAAVEAPRLLR